jgi:hypothetical protein
MNDDVLELRVHMALVSNRLVRVDNPVMRHHMKKLDKRMDMALQKTATLVLDAQT